MDTLWNVFPALVGVAFVIGAYALLGYGIYRLVKAIIDYAKKHD